MSQEQTAPNFTMQKAGREDQAKVFLGALTVQENMGRGAADPTYLYEDNIKYKEVNIYLKNTAKNKHYFFFHSKSCFMLIDACFYFRW